MAKSIHYGAPFPWEELPWIPLERPKPRGKIRVWCLSETVLGVRTHWLHGQTQPHTEPASMCEGCLERRKVDWRGYVCACRPETGHLVILEITKGGYRANEWLHDGWRSLRGLLIEAYRRGDRDNSPVVYSVDRQHEDPSKLPAVFDLEPHLERCWAIDPVLRLLRSEIGKEVM